MKCEKCGKNAASVHYRTNYNGKVTEKHLCAECAHEDGLDNEFFGKDMFEDLFNDFFGGRSLFGRSLFDGFGLMPSMLRTLTLPRFDILFDGVETEQKTENKTEAKTEEKPVEVDPEISRKRELNALREQLKKAVGEENYEEAIVLRDKIRELEK